MIPVKSHLNSLLKFCEKFALSWKMEFNPKKSLSYCSDASYSTEHFYVNGVALSNVESFEYLGLPVGNSKFVNDTFVMKFRDVEKNLFSLNSIGFYPHLMSAYSLSFIYRVYCQPTINYGLDLCYLKNKTLNLLESSQSTLLKSNLGLGKFCRSGPLLDAMNVERVSSIYWKMKFSFFKQVKLHKLTCSLFDYLDSYYEANKCKNKMSFFSQILEMKRILGVDSLQLPKSEVRNILFSKFRCHECELVEAVKTIICDCSDLGVCREKLRSTLWVEFHASEPLFFVLNDT